MDRVATNPLEDHRMQAQISEEREQEINDVNTILATPQGRRFFGRIYREVEKMSYTGNSGTYVNEGIRYFCKELWKDVVKANPGIASNIAIEVYREQVEESEVR